MNAVVAEPSPASRFVAVAVTHYRRRYVTVLVIDAIIPQLTDPYSGDMTTKILVLHDSNSGNTERMALQVARGVERVDGAEAFLRGTPPVGALDAPRVDAVPDTGAPYATLTDLANCDGLVLGSPTHFGNMTASMKYFIDGTTTCWLAGTLAGKPAAVFTSTGSMHGGQEATLLTMMVPLLHHGMLIVGLPYSNPGLMQTSRGGTPYGASHVSGEAGDATLDNVEEALCRALGARVATLADRLAASA